MQTSVQKWGNSQGLRVPREIMNQANIAVGDEVDISIHNGDIVIRPVTKIRGKYNLKNLVAKIPDYYQPAELSWGKPAGREAW